MVADILNILCAKIPNISREIKKEGDYINGLPHMVFSIVFVRYLIKAHKNICDRGEFINCVNFMDYMAKEDNEIKELLTVSVIEEMLSERNIINDIKSMCSSELKNEIESSEKFYGWID